MLIREGYNPSKPYDTPPGRVHQKIKRNGAEEVEKRSGDTSVKPTDSPSIMDEPDDPLLTEFPTMTLSAIPTWFSLTANNNKKLTTTLPQKSEVWKDGPLTPAKLDAFAAAVLPNQVRAQLDQPFGKDSLYQTFCSEKCFRHILLPLFKSGFLPRRAIKNLEKASRRVRQLQMMRKRYSKICFRKLQGFQPDWETTKSIRRDWKEMTSACLLHFNGDAAAMVRWIGGPHVNAHLDVNKIMHRLQPAVDDDIFQAVKRILTMGAPTLCNAEATDNNFQAALQYGNHKSVRDNEEVYGQTIIKNTKRGLILIMDPNLIHFTLNAHISPQGLVDINDQRRKPRPICDSSFRPFPTSHAINDWTCKTNEPPLHFAQSFMRFCIWQWNLAITYPNEDRYTGDDDVQCAFPRLKYNPNLVAMHSAIACNTLIMNSGLAFGDNTSPSNWEPFARARQQYAQHLWNQPTSTMLKASPYLPPFKFAIPATPEERARFARAIPDSINTGVLNPDGSRKPPTYNHHVDDNMYADIQEYLPRTIAASVVALYDIFGYPDGTFPDPLSWEKFEATYSHKRRVVGWEFDTRDLTFSLPSDKRTVLVNLLDSWKSKTNCTLLEAAELHGSLAHAARANRKGSVLFFSLQNAMRRAIQQRYHQVKGFHDRKATTARLSTQLPTNLQNRVESLVSREVAALMWRTKTKIAISQEVADELHHLHSILSDFSIPWSISIGHIIPREAQMISHGDACGTGGGAFSHELSYWFDVIWSPKITKQFQEGKIHINLLEFIVVILQLAATIVRQEEACPVRLFHPLEKLIIRSDNSPSVNWAHKISAKSARGQPFVRLYADLLDRTNLTIDCTHIAGTLNPIADLISRPPAHFISRSDRYQQIFQAEPKLKLYNFFQPSPELVSCLVSRLCTEPLQEHHPMPKQLGQFEADASIISSSVII
jgi:hypothetical protein